MCYYHSIDPPSVWEWLPLKYFTLLWCQSWRFVVGVKICVLVVRSRTPVLACRSLAEASAASRVYRYLTMMSVMKVCSKSQNLFPGRSGKNASTGLSIAGCDFSGVEGISGGCLVGVSERAFFPSGYAEVPCPFCQSWHTWHCMRSPLLLVEPSSSPCARPFTGCTFGLTVSIVFDIWSRSTKLR